MDRVLKQLDKDLLRKYCSDFNLSKGGSPEEVIDRLMVKIFELEPLFGKKKSKKEDGKRENSDESKSRKSKDHHDGEEKKSGKRQKHISPPQSSIKKGAYTAQEFHDKFNLTDLHEFCKSHKLPRHGPKKEIIKRIIQYLETGEVPEPKSLKRKKKVVKPKKNKKRKPNESSKSSSSSSDDEEKEKKSEDRMQVDKVEEPQQKENGENHIEGGEHQVSEVKKPDNDPQVPVENPEAQQVPHEIPNNQ